MNISEAAQISSSTHHLIQKVPAASFFILIHYNLLNKSQVRERGREREREKERVSERKRERERAREKESESGETGRIPFL